MEKSQHFTYGTHYYRPPSPPRGEHKAHLLKIKNELGYNLVKFRLLWNWFHRGPDEFHWDEVHELFDICDEIGLDVQLEINLETAPYWLEQQNPEARYVNANGRAIELGSQEATPAGGHPGLCFHNAAIRTNGEKFLRALIREFRDRKSLKLYDAWNEPHLEPAWCATMWGNMGDKVYCYCEGSRIAFRTWLQKRYGTLDAFNGTWGRAYTDFSQVSPPILHGAYADWIDWIRFWLEALQENMSWRVQVMKEEDPGRLVASHSGAVPPVLSRVNACIDNWKFADPVDLWGSSFAPQAFSWDLATCAQVLELTRSAARGKPYWIAEMPGGAGSILGFDSSRIPRPQDYHAWNWLSVALGSTGTLHWWYYTERTGHESGNFGLIRPNGEHTPRSLATAETAARLFKHQDIIMNSRPETQVAILYGSDNSSLLFAMELSDRRYGHSHMGYYRSVWKSDLTARYVTYDTLDDIKERVLIVPMGLTMPDHVIDWLARFVKKGGVLITDARTAMFNENGFMRPNLPGGALREAAGVVEGEQVCTDPAKRVTVPTADGTIDENALADNLPPLDPMHLGPPISFREPVEVEIPAHGFLTPLKLEGARAIGRHGDMVLASCNDHGKGRVYYFGTYMGLALDKNIPEAHELLRHILLEHAEPVIRGDRLRPRLLESEDGALLMIFNDHRTETITESVSIPDGFAYVRDVVTGESCPVSDGKVMVGVEAENAVVLRLERV